jgi:hypothetical protein
MSKVTDENLKSFGKKYRYLVDYITEAMRNHTESIYADTDEEAV